MGRKKIAIRPLTEDRNRNVTFLKRKAGLMKKAWELSVLCHADISMIIFSQQGKLFEFSSKNLDESLRRYHDYTGPVERKRGADYAAANGGDGDEDDDRSSSDGEGVAAAASAGPSSEAIPPTADAAGKSSNGTSTKKSGGTGQSVHSNLRGKEEWKEATRSGYLGAGGSSGGWNASGGMNGSGKKRLRDGDDTDMMRRNPRISSPGARDRAYGLGGASPHSDRSDDGMDYARRSRPVHISIPSARYSPPPPQPAMNSLYTPAVYRSHSTNDVMPMRLDDRRSDPPQLPVMGPYSHPADGPDDWTDPNNYSVEQLHAQMRAEQAALEELRRRAAQNAEWQRRIEDSEMASAIGINLGPGAHLGSFGTDQIQQDAEMRAMLADIMAAEQGNAQSHAAYQARLQEQAHMDNGGWQTSQPEGLPVQQQTVSDLLDVMRAGDDARRPGLSRSQSTKENMSHLRGPEEMYETRSGPRGG